MWKTAEGSTGRLLQLCFGYFSLYTVYMVLTKYYREYPDRAHGMMKDMPLTVYTTVGGMLVCLAVVLVLGWYRMQSNGRVSFCGVSFPGEFLYIVPSGLCTAVIIPTTTLMYVLPISVMVATVIMRGCVIVVSRLVDAVQIAQGILHKKVYWQENVAALFAIVAVCMNLFWPQPNQKAASFEFLHSKPAVITLSSYLVSYVIRIYLMNYFKNTRAKGVKQDNKGYFAIEQITATIALPIFCVLVFFSPALWGWHGESVDDYRNSFLHPSPHWAGATAAGMLFGVVAFFSVFLFMFKGRTATFAGLVNRLTSLIAGTTSTIVFWLAFHGGRPAPQEWGSLAVILVAVGFLCASELRRAAELAAAREVEAK